MKHTSAKAIDHPHSIPEQSVQSQSSKPVGSTQSSLKPITEENPVAALHASVGNTVIERKTVTHESDLPSDVGELQSMYGNAAIVQAAGLAEGALNHAEPSEKVENIPENHTGMPAPLKTGLEQLSGMDLSGIRVHTNSSRPAQLNALAYTYGQDIHVGPGQEKHLPHEGWHVVQQLQGRVQPTMQAKGLSINDDADLEREADVMGAKALQMKRAEQVTENSVCPGFTLLGWGAGNKGKSEFPAETISASEVKVHLNSQTTGKQLSANHFMRNTQQFKRQAIVQRKAVCSSTYVAAKKSSKVTEQYALIGQGEIIPWSAAMHPEPPKFKKVPHDNTCEDVTRGTKVIILGHNSKWMYVHTMGNAGFISKELIKFDIVPEVAIPSFMESLERLRAKAKAGVSPRLFVETQREAVMIKTVEDNEKWNLKVARSSLIIKFKHIKDAFLILKKAENKPTELTVSDMILVDIGTKQLKDTGRYHIDSGSRKASFKTNAGTQIKIDSIEDFILFVEKIEDTYSSSSVEDIVSEIRQMWLSDMNWEILVDSRGIKESNGNFVDIETKPNPIAEMFDMKDMAPKGKEKLLSSPLGKIAISHVISGIDAYLSGSPSLARAKSHVKKQGRDTDDVELKHKTLTGQHGGDPTDFTTWSGDLGQGYAEYLVDKYVKGNSSTKLKSFMDVKAPDSQLLADIHGYIAVQVWKSIPERDTPSGAKKKLSNILRDLYLVNKKGISSKSNPVQIPRTYKSHFENITKKKGSALNDYIKERSLKFGSPWYAKKAVDYRGWYDSEGLWKEDILKNSMNEFDNNHKDNDNTAAANDMLDFYVQKFVNMLNKEMQ